MSRTATASRPARAPRSGFRRLLTTASAAVVLAVLGALLPAIPAAAAGLGLTIDTSRPQVALITVTHPGAPSLGASLRRNGGPWLALPSCVAASGQVAQGCSWGPPLDAGTYEVMATGGGETIFRTMTVPEFKPTIEVAGDGSVAVTFTNPNGSGTWYRMVPYAIDTESYDAAIDAPASGGPTTRVVIPKERFRAGVGYLMDVSYSTTVPMGRVSSGFSLQVVGYPVFTAPRDVRVTLPNNNISIGLSAPEVSPDDLQYRFRYRVQGTSAWTVIDTGASSGHIGTVTPGYTYEITVTTLNVVNGVKYEHGTSPIVLASPFGPPDAPQVSAPVIGNRSLSVTGGFPTRQLAPSNAAEGKWEIGEATTAGGAPAWRAVTPTVSGTTYGFSGLVAGRYYSVRAQAVNEAGTSDWTTLFSGAQMTGSPDAPRITAGTPRDRGLALDVDVPQSAGAASTGLRFEIATVTGGVVGAWSAITAT
ncbi:MAG: fibronectin type III domain-containing protein, partial [Naasia sp.]